MPNQVLNNLGGQQKNMQKTRFTPSIGKLTKNGS